MGRQVPNAHERPWQGLGLPVQVKFHSVRSPCAAISPLEASDRFQPPRASRSEKRKGGGTAIILPTSGSGASVFLTPAWLKCLCHHWQVKIMTEKELLAVACEQFLGKNVQDIKNVVLQTLEGHLRSILGEALSCL